MRSGRGSLQRPGASQAGVRRAEPHTSPGASHRDCLDPCGRASVGGFGENGAAVARDFVLPGREKRSCGPPEPVVLNPLHKPFDFSLRPEGSIKAKPFGSDKTNRNCGTYGVKMWADCGITGVRIPNSRPNREHHLWLARQLTAET